MIDVSIIIVTWNNENEIKDCLDSIYRETKNLCFEIIVVDNDSRDNTVMFIKDNFCDVKVVSSGGNLGFSKANNIGLNLSKGKNILFLNPDVVVLDNAIEKMLKHLGLNNNYGIVSCRLLNKDLTLQNSTFRFLRWYLILIEQFNLHMYFKKTLGTYLNYFGEYTRIVDWCIGACLLISRNDVLKIDAFTEKYFMYSEDMDICYKVKKILKKEIVYLFDTYIIHLGGMSENQDLNNSRSKKILDSIEVFLTLHKKNRRKTYLYLFLFSYWVKKFMFKIINLFNLNNKFSAYIKKYSDNINHIKKILS